MIITGPTLVRIEEAEIWLDSKIDQALIYTFVSLSRHKRTKNNQRLCST